MVTCFLSGCSSKSCRRSCTLFFKQCKIKKCDDKGVSGISKKKENRIGRGRAAVVTPPEERGEESEEGGACRFHATTVMKKPRAYIRTVPVDQIFDHPEATLASDLVVAGAVLLSWGTRVEEIGATEKQRQSILRKLENAGIREVNLKFGAEEMDTEEVTAIMQSLDATVRMVDFETNERILRGLVGTFEAPPEEGKPFSGEGLFAVADMIEAELARTSQVLMSLNEPRNHEEYLHVHSFNVSLLAGYLARRVQSLDAASAPFPEGFVRAAIVAGLCFDLGKLLIPKEILGSPRKLTPEEFSLVRHHSLHSEELARKAGITDPLVLAAIRSHHEQFDGKGYPDGLSGKQIPLLASIVHVADAFDALTTNRIYKSAVSVKEALNVILYYSGEHFDPDVCRCFISGIGFYPPGSVVRLSDERIATVVSASEGNMLQPKVCVTDEKGARVPLDLSGSKIYIKECLQIERKKVYSPALEAYGEIFHQL